jgi:cell wall-associated NlpC family hydrolase
MTYSVTRNEITEAAFSLIGTRFRHQGRDKKTGVDCVGLLVVVGRMVNYPDIVDLTDYRRTPSAETIYETLKTNCDEIPLSEAGDGDFYQMRLHGIKPRHVAIRHGNGVIHAASGGVRWQPFSDFPAVWFVRAFRCRGLVV